MRSPRQHTLVVDDTKLSVFEWGSPGGQQVVLAHATGFHARCWDQVVAALPGDWQIFAIEARGHGRSANQPPYHWARFADDLMGMLTLLEVSNAIGVGHSMGGHCVAHVCARQANFFRRLVLIDPVIFPADMYADKPLAFDQLDDHPVARRRSHFDNWQELFDRLKTRHPYTLWQAQVFEDYCHYGVEDGADGGVDLCCPGPVEAQVYMNNFDTDIYPLLPLIKQPVLILRAPQNDMGSVEMDFAASPTSPDLADAFPNAQDIYLPQLTHFMPMQDPTLIADYIQRERLAGEGELQSPAG